MVRSCYVGTMPTRCCLGSATGDFKYLQTCFDIAPLRLWLRIGQLAVPSSIDLLLARRHCRSSTLTSQAACPTIAPEKGHVRAFGGRIWLHQAHSTSCEGAKQSGHG